MILIFYLSSQSYISVGEQKFGGKESFNYVWHSIEYLFLSLFMSRGFDNSKFKKNFTVLSFLTSSLYGVSDEVHQYFVPGRTFSFMDILFDILGAVIGILLYKLLRNNVHKL